MNTFQQQLNDSPVMPIFEIEVIDKAGNADYIICEISVRGDQLIAQREAVSKKEENSAYIANSSIDIDSDCFFTGRTSAQDLSVRGITTIYFSATYTTLQSS